MMNGTNIYKFKNKLNWKKYFATELLDPSRIATVCFGRHMQTLHEKLPFP